jgi:hypothetical protein
MVVVQDDDYTDAIERLESAGFDRSVPNRTPPPEIMENHPNPQQMMEEINTGYKRFDRSCAILYVIPNSFAHIFQEDIPRPSTEIGDSGPRRFETYGILHYPLEQSLVESFV